MALFPHGMYIEIESLRLDLHLKKKQKKTTTTTATTIPENMCSLEGKKKKKGVAVRERRSCGGLGLARLDLAWLDRIACISISSSSSSLSLSLFFFFPSAFLHFRSLIIIIFGLEIES